MDLKVCGKLLTHHQRGYVLTPDFGKVRIAMKMVSSERIFSAWKDSRHRVEPLWCFGYIHSTLSYGPKLYSEWHNSMFRVVFGQSRLQDDLGWRSTLKELSSSRRGDRFWYINHLNPSSYAKVRGNTLQTEPQRKYGARCQTLVW